VTVASPHAPSQAATRPILGGVGRLANDPARPDRTVPPAAAARAEKVLAQDASTAKRSVPLRPKPCARSRMSEPGGVGLKAGDPKHLAGL
jgi:hypothetical protein